MDLTVQVLTLCGADEDNECDNAICGGCNSHASEMPPIKGAPEGYVVCECDPAQIYCLEPCEPCETGRVDCGSCQGTGIGRSGPIDSSTCSSCRGRGYHDRREAEMRQARAEYDRQRRKDREAEEMVEAGRTVDVDRMIDRGDQLRVLGKSL